MRSIGKNVHHGINTYTWERTRTFALAGHLFAPKIMYDIFLKKSTTSTPYSSLADRSWHTEGLCFASESRTPSAGRHTPVGRQLGQPRHYLSARLPSGRVGGRLCPVCRICVGMGASVHICRANRVCRIQRREDGISVSLSIGDLVCVMFTSVPGGCDWFEQQRN